MIQIHMIDGRNCPMPMCDVCGERIEDAGKAAVVFQNFTPNGSRLGVRFVHKGSIDGRTCHDKAEAEISTAGGKPGWEELKMFLANLAFNVGFPARDMAAHDNNRSRP